MLLKTSADANRVRSSRSTGRWAANREVVTTIQTGTLDCVTVAIDFIRIELQRQVRPQVRASSTSTHDPDTLARLVEVHEIKAF